MLREFVLADALYRNGNLPFDYIQVAVFIRIDHIVVGYDSRRHNRVRISALPGCTSR